MRINNMKISEEKREEFEREASLALGIPQYFIEEARLESSYNHAFDSLSKLQPLSEWWHWFRVGLNSKEEGMNHDR